MKNKKGALTDLFLFMAVAFAMIIFMVAMTYVGNTTYSKLQERAPQIQKALGNSENATQLIEDTYGKVPMSYTALKWISVMLIFGLMLSIILTSFLVKTNPVFFVPYVFIIILAIIVAVPISNAYESISANPTLAPTFTGFFGASWIFLHLPIWVAGIGILAGVLMFVNVLRNP